MDYQETITISASESTFINKAMQSKDMMGEDDAVIHTAHFVDGVEMDVKLCGAQDDTPWTEAVLFKDGYEVCCSEPGVEYNGPWTLEYDGNTYTATVMMEKLENGEKEAERIQEPEHSGDPGLDTAKQLIRQFAYAEYGSDEVDFSDPEHVGIAYTTITDEEREIQVEVDLVHFTITQLVDGVCVDRWGYGSLQELTEKELSCLDFDDLISLSREAERRMKKMEDLETGKTEAGKLAVTEVTRVCRQCGGTEFASGYRVPAECVVNGSGELIRFLETDIEDAREACGSGIATGPFVCLSCFAEGKTLEEITVAKELPPIGACLMEKPGEHGLDGADISGMMRKLGEMEVYPVEFFAAEHECSAMGFVTAEFAEVLEYDYQELAKYVAGILDDMDQETEDGLYPFHGFTIMLSR